MINKRAPCTIKDYGRRVLDVFEFAAVASVFFLETRLLNAPRSHCAHIVGIGTVSAAGLGLAELRDSLICRRSATAPSMRFGKEPLAYGLCNIESGTRPRGQALIDACLAQIPHLGRAVEHFGRDRVAVVMGASVSGMTEIERAMARRAETGSLPEGFAIRDLNLYEPARRIADALGITGPAWSLSNACASGSMAVASAVRLLETGLTDAVIAGAVDAASRFTTAGFCALGAVSPQPCRPFARERNGINLGEGGAVMLLTRRPPDFCAPIISVAGFAESTDAHHISAPDPSGAGAAACMKTALARAGLAPEDVDLVSAHGTATAQNDAMEARAVAEVFGRATPLVSYKPLSGHTLAGAGALQAAIAAALLTGNDRGVLPGCGPAEPDEDIVALSVDLLRQTRVLGRPLKSIMTNAFAFGGSNASVVYAAPDFTDVPEIRP